MIERTDAITNEVLEPVTFVLAFPTVFVISQMLYLRLGKIRVMRHELYRLQTRSSILQSV